jgi:hypothetical protein
VGENVGIHFLIITLQRLEFTCDSNRRTKERKKETEKERMTQEMITQATSDANKNKNNIHDFNIYII